MHFSLAEDVAGRCALLLKCSYTAVVVHYQPKLDGPPEHVSHLELDEVYIQTMSDLCPLHLYLYVPSWGLSLLQYTCILWSNPESLLRLHASRIPSRLVPA